MRIKWYGTASLMIEGGNTRILLDPYLRELNPSLAPFPVEEAAQADAALITHPHLDHFSDVGVLIGAGLKKIYVSENGIAHAQENGIPIAGMVPVGANERFTVGDIIVRTFQSRHCKFDAATVLSVLCSPRTYRQFGNAVKLLRKIKRYQIGDDIYCFELSCEGKRVVVLGSAGMEEDVEYPRGADLFVFPYQGRSGMHRYMVPFVQTFAPDKVMLDHFDDAFPPFTRKVGTERFLQTMKKRFPDVEALIPEENTWYEV
ncbi:MAG: MBL fold metallo-hydrolase [Candidatus Gallimonas sp.]